MRTKIERRAFITLLGGAAAWPLTVRGQARGQDPVMQVVGLAPPGCYQGSDQAAGRAKCVQGLAHPRRWNAFRPSVEKAR